MNPGKQNNSNLLFQRLALAAAGAFLILFFQNFSNVKNFDLKSMKVKKMDNASLRWMASTASTYANFQGEEVQKMSDAEILGRVSDSMFTSLEVMKMEAVPANNQGQVRRKELEIMARALEKDARLQKMVIFNVRRMASSPQTVLR